MTLTVALAGGYVHRSPLAYSAIRETIQNRVMIANGTHRSDLVLIAHPRDIKAHSTSLAEAVPAGKRLVLLSEEPFWDTIWGEDPLCRYQVHETNTGFLACIWLNHFTSPIFDFDLIPYFIMTDRRYFNRYALRFGPNAARSEEDWRSHFDRLRRTAFVAERRHNPKFDRTLHDGDVFGLSAMRTRLAEASTGDHILRIGRGWQKGVQRQQGRDWHLEKLQMLDGQTRILSGIENTHAHNYVTEKIFDAFAVGALPLYVAAPDHRVHDIVPKESFLNLYGMTDAEAAEAVAGVEFTPERIEAYREAQVRLAELFGSGRALAAERDRLGRALTNELSAVVENG